VDFALEDKYRSSGHVRLSKQENPDFLKAILDGWHESGHRKTVISTQRERERNVPLAVLILDHQVVQACWNHGRCWFLGGWASG
jgi:hypothetical protein